MRCSTCCMLLLASSALLKTKTLFLVLLLKISSMIGLADEKGILM